MHLTQFTDQTNIPELVRSIRGLNWCSRFFNYQIIMLENLAPNSPAVQNPPFNGFPPPHLLIGYAYLMNVNNNYHFTNRTYSRLRYDSRVGNARRARNFWSLLSDCSYEVRTNTNLFSGPRFEENIFRTHQDILQQRIIADMQARNSINLQGSGITLQPEATENINLQNELNSLHTTSLEEYLQSHNFALPQMYQYETDKDLASLYCINLILKIITNFLYNWLYNNEKEYIPWQENFFEVLLEKYKDWLPEKNENYMDAFLLANKIADTDNLNWETEIYGGAKLRSGTRTDLPIRLRQRQNQRAITETIRRQRGQIVQRFIDSLPLVRRIRRPRPPSPESPEDAGEGPSGLQEDVVLGTEILRILRTILRQLRNELTDAAREHEIFNFASRFYSLLERANTEGRINAEYICRFFFYFFLIEHISSTLFYYHALLNLNVSFRNYVNVNYTQVIITGRNINGNVNLHRIWHNNNISPFVRIFRTILRDILIICDRTPQQLETAVQAENLLAALEHRAESGDPNDIIEQARLHEEEVENVTVSFKLNLSGLVTTSTNRAILANTNAVRAQEMRRLRAPR